MLVDKKFFQCCMNESNFLITYSVAGGKTTYAVCNDCKFLDCFLKNVVEIKRYDEEFWIRYTSEESEYDEFCKKFAWLYIIGDDTKLFPILNVTKKEFTRIAKKGTEIADEFIMSLVKDGFIERYKFQKRRIKYQLRKIIQRRNEIRAIGSNEELIEIHYENERLNMANKKLQSDQLMLETIYRHASHIPEVKAQFDSLNAAKL